MSTFIWQTVDEAPKPRRPAGAVSMFGGMDPSALLKKKSSSQSEQKPTDAAAEQTTPSAGSVVSFAGDSVNRMLRDSYSFLTGKLESGLFFLGFSIFMVDFKGSFSRVQIQVLFVAEFKWND